MGGLSISEILVIIGILLLLFGGKKIPELMKGLGQGIREFKKASKGDISEGQNAVETNRKD